MEELNVKFKSCHNCALGEKQSEARIYCSDCKCFFCDECNVETHKPLVFKRHERVNIYAGMIETLKVCKDHNQKKILYCEKCLEFLCEQCLKHEEHKGHKVTLNKDEAERIPVSIFDQATIGSSIEEIKKFQEFLKLKMIYMKKEFERCLALIEKKNIEIIQTFENEYNKCEEVIECLNNLKTFDERDAKDDFLKVLVGLVLPSRLAVYKGYQNAELEIINSNFERLQETLSNFDVKPVIAFTSILNIKYLFNQDFDKKRFSVENQRKVKKLVDDATYLPAFLSSPIKYGCRIEFLISKLREADVMIGVADISQKNQPSIYNKKGTYFYQCRSSHHWYDSKGFDNPEGGYKQGDIISLVYYPSQKKLEFLRNQKKISDVIIDGDVSNLYPAVLLMKKDDEVLIQN